MRTMLFFFFNDTATTEIYTLSLHDALPISGERLHPRLSRSRPGQAGRIETLSVLPRTRPALVHTIATNRCHRDANGHDAGRGIGHGGYRRKIGRAHV